MRYAAEIDIKLSSLVAIVMDQLKSTLLYLVALAAIVHSNILCWPGKLELPVLSSRLHFFLLCYVENKFWQKVYLLM